MAHPQPTSVHPLNATPRPFIAADIGGTHVRIGLVRADATPERPVSVLAYRKYACADHASPVEIFRAFIADLDPALLDPARPLDEAVIASAGYLLDDGSLLSANLPWPLSPQRLRDALGFRDLRVVNDFEAVAYAATQADLGETVHLCGPATAVAPGPTLVLGPGTGLGAALWIPSGDQAVVLATEAGQAALTPGNEIEMTLLAEMLRHRRHVPVEAALSGPGLMNLHGTLCAVRGVHHDYRTPGEITAAAQSGRDPLARESLDIFCGLLGSLVGDMALLYGVHGGIYLAGGILPQIRDFLQHSSFVARFLDKGPMRTALERIPVRLVDHGQLGVIGAANWYLRQRGRYRPEPGPAA